MTNTIGVEGGDTMAHTDLDALKERLRTARATKRVYKKRVAVKKLSVATRTELMIKVREAQEFAEEAFLERDALTYQAYKTGLSQSELADALKIKPTTLHKRIQRMKERLT